MLTEHPLHSLQRLEEFPITRNRVFLAHAAASPLPARAISAVSDYVSRAGEEGQWSYLHADIEKQVRKCAADMMGAGEDEIAFTGSTSAGLSIVAQGLPWESGDNVVAYEGDFPSNIYPWLNLSCMGIETRFIPHNRDACVTVEDVAAVVNGRTRLVSLSTVNYVTGYRIDLASIGRFLKDRGILFCVDVIQSMGAFPLDTRYVDFAASNTHKWLLGPLGMGLLMVKREQFENLRPVFVGWKSVASPHDYLNCSLDFPDSALRFEPSGTSILGLVALRASMQLLLQYGIESIAARITTLRRQVYTAVRNKGYDVVGPPCGEKSSGIISFTSPVHDIEKIRRDMDCRGIVVSLRDVPGGGKCMRVAPHFYNTEDEIERFAAELPPC